MTNKEKLKKSINNSFNKEYNYKEIIKKIEGGNMKKNVWKWSLVPVCLIAIIGSLIFTNYKNKNNDLSNPNTLYTEQEKNIKLNINNIEKAGALKLDADIKELSTNGINIPWPEILKDGITIPKDLDKFNGYRIFTRKDNSSEYDTLNCTVYNYSNKNDNDYRNIRIAVSNTNKPIRDYLFSDEGSKETIINDVKIIIYKYNNIYFTEFKFKDYNFDIETDNITEKELLTLLLSIIE